MVKVLITFHIDPVLIEQVNTVDNENQKLTDIFCDNLRRYLDRIPLRNLLDKKLLTE